MPATDLGGTITHGETTFAKFVLERISQESALLRGGARFITITGRSAKLPRVVNDGSAQWVAEGVEIPSDAAEGDLLELVPRKVANVMTLSNECINDAGVGELDQVRNSLTRSVAVATDARAFSTSAPTALAPGGLLPGLQTGIGPVSLDNIVRAVGAIEAVGGIATTWINPVDLTALRLVKASEGSNAPVLQPDLQAGGAERVAGTSLISTPALPADKAIVAYASQSSSGTAPMCPSSSASTAASRPTQSSHGSWPGWTGHERCVGPRPPSSRMSPRHVGDGPPTQRVVVVQLFEGPMNVMTLAPGEPDPPPELLDQIATSYADWSTGALPSVRVLEAVTIRQSMAPRNTVMTDDDTIGITCGRCNRDAQVDLEELVGEGGRDPSLLPVLVPPHGWLSDSDGDGIICGGCATLAEKADDEEQMEDVRRLGSQRG